MPIRTLRIWGEPDIRERLRQICVAFSEYMNFISPLETRQPILPYYLSIQIQCHCQFNFTTVQCATSCNLKEKLISNQTGFFQQTLEKKKKKDEIVSERSKANCPSCRQRPAILDQGRHEEAGHYGGCRGRIWPLYCSGRVSDSSQTFQFGWGVSGLDTTLRLLGNNLG